MNGSVPIGAWGTTSRREHKRTQTHSRRFFQFHISFVYEVHTRYRTSLFSAAKLVTATLVVVIHFAAIAPHNGLQILIFCEINIESLYFICPLWRFAKMSTNEKCNLSWHVIVGGNKLIWVLIQCADIIRRLLNCSPATMQGQSRK